MSLKPPFRYFSDQVILDHYYANYGINPHNIDTKVSLNLSQYYAQGRSMIARHWGFLTHEVTLQANVLMINQLLLQLINHAPVAYIISESGMSSFSERVTTINWAQLSALLTTTETNQNLVFYYFLDFLPTINYQQLFALIQLVRTKFPNACILVNANPLFYCCNEQLSDFVDGLVLDANALFQIGGVALLLLKQQWHHMLQPVILGGGGYLSWTLDQWINKPFPQGYEAGTNNLANWYLLIHYFMFYLDNQAQIIQDYEPISLKCFNYNKLP